MFREPIPWVLYNVLVIVNSQASGRSESEIVAVGRIDMTQGLVVGIPRSNERWVSSGVVGVPVLDCCLEGLVVQCSCCFLDLIRCVACK